jgi:hypothetical protein
MGSLVGNTLNQLVRIHAFDEVLDAAPGAVGPGTTLLLLRVAVDLDVLIST